MGITIGGTSLDTLVWNVRTLGDRMVTAGRRGANLESAGLDGTRWRPNKPLGELAITLSMWIVGSNFDGALPGTPTQRQAVRTRLDTLLRLINQQEALTTIADTASNRRCRAEIQAALGPATMAGATRMELQLPLVIPAGCWEDVAEFASATVVFGASTAVTIVGGGGGTLPLTGLTIKLTPPASNVRITTAGGKWVQFNGALPAGADTWLVLAPENPQAYQTSVPGTSLLASLDLPDVIPLSIPAATADPVVQVTAAGTSGATRIAFTGRRRYATA
jgi:hypothetical protein